MANYKPKTCQQCATEFTPNTGNARYCSDECRKTANQILHRKWWADHRRLAIEGSRKWRQLNPEAARKSSLLSVRKWRAKNPEVATEMSNHASRKWKAKNPEKVGAYYARRAQVEIEGNATTKDIQDKWSASDKTCILCGEPISQSLKPTHRMARTIEHLTPIARGGRHDIDNIGFAHRSCNASKGVKTLEEYRDWQSRLQQAN